MSALMTAFEIYVAAIGYDKRMDGKLCICSSLEATCTIQPLKEVLPGAPPEMMVISLSKPGHFGQSHPFNGNALVNCMEKK